MQSATNSPASAPAQTGSSGRKKKTGFVSMMAWRNWKESRGGRSGLLTLPPHALDEALLSLLCRFRAVALGALELAVGVGVLGLVDERLDQSEQDGHDDGRFDRLAHHLHSKQALLLAARSSGGGGGQRLSAQAKQAPEAARRRRGVR